MKKTICLVLAALIMAASGVAAVSAYEAHLINVKAHVENALTVDTVALEYGTVFPQEWFKDHKNISLSESALGVLGTAAGNLSSVSYEIYAECKPIIDPVTGNITGYYDWIGEWLYVGIDPTQTTVDPFDETEMVRVGPKTITCGQAAQATGCTGNLSVGDTVDCLAVMFLAPAFEDYYNALTDVNTKPAWWPADWAPIPNTDPRHIPGGVDLGLDLKVQVTGIARVP
jgi:hypothetical protein